LTISAAATAYHATPSGSHAASSAFPVLSHKPYRLKFRSGASWTIDPRLFEGAPKLSVTESPSSISVRLTGAIYPGTDLSADLICDYEPNTDVIRFELSAFDLKSSVIATGWVSEETSLTGRISSGCRTLIDKVQLDLQACSVIPVCRLR